MIAIGTPGALPRMWVESSHVEVVLAQMLPGEVAATAIFDDDGRPIPAALPAESDWPPPDLTAVTEDAPPQ